MKVLFVINNFYTKGNGMAASARRTVAFLKDAGVEIKILSGKNPDPEGPQPDFCLEDYTLPIFNYLVVKQGYQFSEYDRKTCREAVAWADVVHLEEPFVLECHVARYAARIGKAVTATYHLHPENLLASVHLDGVSFFSDATVRMWNTVCYKYCSDIQCPTQNVMDRLKKAKFKSRLHVISNGLILDNVRSTAVRDPQDKAFNIVNIGRYSVEKDQQTLFKAMRYSKHAKEIRLIFAGKGPEEDNYRKTAEKLVSDGVLQYAPQFVFLDAQGLKDLARTSDLFVHCAYIEVEGLSCLESLQEGLVPLIAEGKLSATSQFALDHHSVFPAKDPKALAKKIDWWIEHPDRLRKMEKAYAKLAKDYDIHKSIDALIRMFEKALSSKKRPDDIDESGEYAL